MCVPCVEICSICVFNMLAMYMKVERLNLFETETCTGGIMMNQKKKLHAMAIIMMLFLTAWTCNKDKTIHAAAKTYGLLIGNAKGQYTYYDLNGAKGTQKIERASNGTVMLPVKKVCSYMPDILYEYNWSTSKATVRNKKNGKRIVISKGSPYITTYSSASKTAKAKKVPERPIPH